MSWANLLAAEGSDATPESVAFGQLRWAGDDDLQVRGARATAGDIAVPGPDGTVHSPLLGELHINPRTVPDRAALICLESMGASIGTRSGQSFEGWLDASPLMPLEGKALDETPLEHTVRKNLGHLESVCRLPHTHLKLEEERQLVGRCKRPSPRAPMVLAMRSEDWARRTLWGIQPKRVLGMVREELYDIYENRLAVALVDRLDEVLGQRIREVRRSVEQARSARDWQDRVAAGTHHQRVGRICELWAAHMESKDLLDRAEGALTRLRHLRRRILSLKTSPLYKRIGGRRRQLHLRMSNLFTHDDRYRGVAALWRAWAGQAQDLKADPQVIWDRMQSATQGMRYYGVLLVLKALKTLGFEAGDAHEDAPFEPGAVLTLKGPIGPITLHWTAHDGLELSHNTAAPLRICALPAMLQAASSQSDWLAGLPAASTLILYLEADRTHLSAAEQDRLSGPGPKDHPVIFVPVAPWQLESVERVARALRWRLWMDFYTTYPAVVSRPNPSWVAPANTPQWLLDARDGLRVVKPTHTPRWPELDRRITEAAASLGALDGKIAEATAQGSRGRRNKKHLSQEHADLSTALAADSQIRDALEAEASALDRLLQCPACHTPADPSQFRQNDGDFSVTCGGCKGTWGQRHCGDCAEPIAFLTHPDHPATATAQTVDADFGCDILSFPAGKGDFCCPSCGPKPDVETDAASDEST